MPDIYELVEATRARLAGLQANVVSYGHLGASAAADAVVHTRCQVPEPGCALQVTATCI